MMGAGTVKNDSGLSDKTIRAQAEKTNDAVKIKICGLRRMEDIEAVNRALPDYCGFIIEFPKSFRSVSADTVRELVKALDRRILPVGVFVNAPVERVGALLRDGTLSLAQLHGQEDESYIHNLRELTDKPLIKAFSIRTSKDAEGAIKSSADYILLDQGGGGTGQTFDWSLIPEMKRKFFLAGGLDADNLKDAVERMHPYAVDLSSSVETNRWKDPEKIQKVVEIIRKRQL